MSPERLVGCQGWCVGRRGRGVAVPRGGGMVAAGKGVGGGGSMSLPRWVAVRKGWKRGCSRSAWWGVVDGWVEWGGVEWVGGGMCGERVCEGVEPGVAWQ